MRRRSRDSSAYLQMAGMIMGSTKDLNKNTLEILMRDVPTWVDPVNAKCKAAFINEICGRGRGYQYGYDAALQAWAFFLKGYNSYNPEADDVEPTPT